MKSSRRVSVIDAHIYGGVLLMGIGAWMGVTWAGPVVAGAFLFALGIMRA